MAALRGVGFETGSLYTETDGFPGTGNGPQGTGASASSSVVRTGSYSLRINPASGVAGYWMPGVGANYVSFALRIATLPSVSRIIVGQNATNYLNLRLNSDGTLSLYNASTLLANGTTALSTGTWYHIWLRHLSGTSAPAVVIDGVTEITATWTASGSYTMFGCTGTEASSLDLYIDDIVNTDNTSNGPFYKVIDLKPISDNTNTNWRKGGGTTTGTDFWEAVNNVPPAGLASASETDTTNVESASNTGTAQYIANLESYSTGGIVSGDTIAIVLPVIRHGEDISTGTKTGTVYCNSNPSGSGDTFTAGADQGAHAGDNSSTTKYNGLFGTAISTPSVTLGTSPSIRVVKTDTTTRVLCVDYMALRVIYSVAVSGSTQTAIAALSATGTIGAAARATLRGASPLSATGTLAGAAKATRGVASSLTAAGNLAGAALLLKNVSAGLSASGTLEGAGLRYAGVAAPLSATGVLAASASPFYGAAAALAGSGTINSRAGIVYTGAAALTASGTLAAAARATLAGAAVLDATGDIAAAAMLVKEVAATLSAIGSIQAAGLRYAGVAAQPTATGTLAGAAGVLYRGAAALSATGTIGAAARATAAGAATLGATGDIEVAGLVTRHVAAALAAQGIVGAAAAPYLRGSASLSAIATMAAVATPLVGVAALMTATGTVTPAARGTFRGASLVEAIGTIAANATVSSGGGGSPSGPPAIGTLQLLGVGR